MNEQIFKDLENIKSCLDVAAQKGVFANIDSAFTISVAYNRIAEFIKNTPPVLDGTN
jgi:hypothetical protein